MEPQQRVLSDLCNVCNKSAPRYRCPGCAARTCSLPCYKLHQQRSVCDGKRDPTKFVKKTQLETAAGVDHDYNFLAGIERDLDDADRELEDRGVGTRDGKRMYLKNFDSFRRRLAETEVVVQKAPVGMSRQKSNKSRWNQRTKGILWTVEWIHDDKSSDIRDIHDTKPLREAYEEGFRNRRSLKRKRGSDGAVRQPDLSSAATADDRSGVADSPQKTRPTVEQPAGQAVEFDSARESQPAAPTEIGNTVPEPVPISAHPTPDFDSTAGETSPAQTQTPLPPLQDQTSAASAQPKQIAQAAESAWNFYLLKPHTYGKQRVLIPLPADSTLLTALRQRVVLEFPTVIVLAEKPGALPEGYVTEATYERMLATERARVDGGLAEEGLSGVDFDEDGKGEVGGGEDGPAEAVDDVALMEVLKKDYTV